MKKIIILICMLLIASCGPALTNSRLDSLLTKQPQVLLTQPANDQIVPPNTKVTALFSQAIDPASVNQQNFAILKNIEEEIEKDELLDDLADLEISGLDGTYIFTDDHKEAIFEPTETFEPGKYLLVITPKVTTMAAIPLNQNPGEEPTSYWSFFEVSAASQPQDLEDPEKKEDSTEQRDQQDQAEVAAEPKQEVKTRPSSLILNEILYDAEGDEADGHLFVELLGDPGSDITDYSIVFVNGANGAETETISIPENSIIPDDGIFLIADTRTGASDQTNVAGADMLDNFDPQNGPDCVQLLDHNQALLDAVGYGTPLPDIAENSLPCFETSPADDAGAGQSLARVDYFDTDNNAGDFIILSEPTPGIE